MIIQSISFQNIKEIPSLLFIFVSAKNLEYNNKLKQYGKN